MCAEREETMAPRKKIAYVQAAWHADITDRCKQAFTAELAKQSYDESGVDFFSAPGSWRSRSWPRSSPRPGSTRLFA
jgi:6,7-dimethyl-8-ribityllumazine synthase